MAQPRQRYTARQYRRDCDRVRVISVDLLRMGMRSVCPGETVLVRDIAAVIVLIRICGVGMSIQGKLPEVLRIYIGGIHPQPQFGIRERFVIVTVFVYRMLVVHDGVDNVRVVSRVCCHRGIGVRVSIRADDRSDRCVVYRAPDVMVPVIR